MLAACASALVFGTASGSFSTFLSVALPVSVGVSSIVILARLYVLLLSLVRHHTQPSNGVFQPLDRKLEKLREERLAIKNLAAKAAKDVCLYQTWKELKEFVAPLATLIALFFFTWLFIDTWGSASIRNIQWIVISGMALMVFAAGLLFLAYQITWRVAVVRWYYDHSWGNSCCEQTKPNDNTIDPGGVETTHFPKKVQDFEDRKALEDTAACSNESLEERLEKGQARGDDEERSNNTSEIQKGDQLNIDWDFGFRN